MKSLKYIVPLLVVLFLFSGASYASIYDLTRRDNPTGSQDSSWYVVDLYEQGTSNLVGTWACVADDGTYWTNQDHTDAVSFVAELNSWNWDNKSWTFADSNQVFAAMWDTFDDDPDSFFDAFDPTVTGAGYEEIWGWASDSAGGSQYWTSSFQWDTVTPYQEDIAQDGTYTDSGLSIWAFGASSGTGVPELPPGVMGMVILFLGNGFRWVRRLIK